MDAAAEKLLDRLVSRRVDPRRGVGRWLGTTRLYVIPVYVASLSVVMLIEKLTGSPGAGVVKSVIVYSAVGALFVCWLIPRGVERRTRRISRTNGGFLCPWCRYVLTGLADAGRCPECGDRYEREVCERLYRNAYGPDAPSGDRLASADRQAWTAAIRVRRGEES